MKYFVFAVRIMVLSVLVCAVIANSLVGGRVHHAQRETAALHCWKLSSIVGTLVKQLNATGSTRTTWLRCAEMAKSVTSGFVLYEQFRCLHYFYVLASDRKGSSTAKQLAVGGQLHFVKSVTYENLTYIPTIHVLLN